MTEVPALRVSVVNGDLSFVSQPLLLGHYRALKLTGTEQVMNELVGSTMEHSLAAGVYPDEPGTHQVFMNTQVDSENPWRPPRPQAVIVVGLGAEGKLTPPQLAMSVRQAVIAWIERLAEQGGAPPEIELAATLIGSGGSGINAGQAAQFIVQGVSEANSVIEQTRRAAKANHRSEPLNWARISHLMLIELYLDRATEAWRAVHMQSAADRGRYLVSETLIEGQGSLKRPLNSGYRGVDYDFISAIAEEGPRAGAWISYTLDTKRARTEVRGQATQAPLLRRLVTGAAAADNTDPEIGRTLFKLLVPVDMEPFFAGASAMVIELNAGTAGIPWELLDTNRDNQDVPPWAIRSKLLRKLRTQEFNASVPDANTDASILIIGEPACDATLYPRLPGASSEARAVCTAMQTGGLGDDRIRSLISDEDGTQPGADARTILNALMERDWRVVHISGHGEPPEPIGPAPKGAGDPPQQFGDPRGVVLSDEMFLGPREIKSMGVVPELVFVNCCFLAARNAAQLLTTDERRQARDYSRPHFAATVAEALIEQGVRCVIAAGWAVDDEPASVFATEFYNSLIAGQRFIDAVSAARLAARAADTNSNTWAAYQCYGDPDWVLRRGAADPQRPSINVEAEFADVASAFALMTALETIAVRSRFHNANTADQRRRLDHLETRFGDLWGSSGEVAEAFGRAWSEVGDDAKAIDWYARALAATDGTASLKAMEQLGNLKARFAEEAVNAARTPRDKVPAKARKGKRASTPARRTVKAAIEDGRKAIAEAMVLFSKLIALSPTVERESLYGSAFKRLAMIEAAAGQPGEEAKAIEGMHLHYKRAEDIRRREKSHDLRPVMNRVAAQLAAARPSDTLEGFAEAIADVRARAAAKAQSDPDFWSFAAPIEVSVFEAIASRGLARRRTSIEREFDELHRRVSAERMWRSIYDTARFVLSKYASRASADERRAAVGLLASLEKLIQPSASERRGARPRDRANLPSEASPMKKSQLKRASVQSARAFVRSAVVPAPRRSRGVRRGGTETEAAFDAAKSQAAVVGSDIISFVQGVTPERRQAIVNSSMLAQLVAKTKVGDASKVYDWYDTYFDVLTNIGWVVQDRDFNEYHEDSKNFDAHKAIIAVATAVLGAAPAALALVTTTLEALQSMDADSPWIRLFDRESRNARTAHFQISLAEQDANGQFFVTMMAFGLEATSTLTQVLFFRTRASEATLRHFSGKVTINTQVLDSVQADIAAKLAAHAADYVKKLPDFALPTARGRAVARGAVQPAARQTRSRSRSSKN